MLSRAYILSSFWGLALSSATVALAQEPAEEAPSDDGSEDSTSSTEHSNTADDDPESADESAAGSDSKQTEAVPTEEVSEDAEPEDPEEPHADESSQSEQSRCPSPPCTQEAEPPPSSSDADDSDPGHADEQKTEEAAAAALVDAPPSGPSLSPIHWSTSTWSRLEVRQNYDKLGVSRGRFQEGDMVFFRARLGLETNPLPVADGSDVLVVFVPQASGHWGQDGTVGEANLGMYEGYFKIRSRRLDVQVGRMKMDYGEAVVIGALDWNQTGRAFDGVRAHYKMDHGYLDLFLTQVAEGRDIDQTIFLGSDQYFWGAYSGFGEYLADGLALDAYVLGSSQVSSKDQELSDGSTVDIKGATQVTLGLRSTKKIGWFDYRIEAGAQLGRLSSPVPSTSTQAVLHTSSRGAFQIDGDLGFSMGEQGRISLGGAFATGDDPSTSNRNEGWDQLYPTAHKFLGLMDIIGPRTNVASGNVKIRRDLFEFLTARLDAHLFARLERGGLGSVGGPGLAGTEIDAQLISALGKFAYVRGLYGMFIPISGQYQSDSIAQYVEVQAGVNF